MESRTLHFSLGPVQGFIARARRTRDLWAGSFLLSYLAGHAMCAVIEAGGKIIFPAVTSGNKDIDDPLLRAIKECREGKVPGQQPVVGSLPNRFKAKIPAGFDPGECVEAVSRAWEKVARAVCNEYAGPVSEMGKDTETIWNRQVSSFWEMTWVLGEDESCLDRRKNWRSNVPPAEPGDKCTIMGNMQEISGYVRAKEKEKQDQFWAHLRNKTGELEIKEGERLCAVSLVKRLFPRVAKKALGWEVPGNYPSTSYIAAIPWILKNMQENEDTAKEFVEKARSGELRNRTYIEKDNGIAIIEQAQNKHPGAADFAGCDGNFFHVSTLANDNLWLKGTGEQREELREKLGDFAGQPSAFYAVLAADGDRLGALLRSAGETVVSDALSRFTGKVTGTVENRGGIIVYAGGDDVLALLPAQGAAGVAAALRQEYRDAFAGTGVLEYLATLSAGLVFAHHHAPLQAVLKEAHYLLNDVAKDKTGRDSLAVRVWNTGGPGLCWAAPWEIAARGEPSLLDELVKEFSSGGPEEKQYNSSFFYNLRQRFSQLFDDQEEAWKELDPVELFVAEYVRSRGGDVDREEARQRMERLMQVCRLYRRITPEKGSEPKIEPQGISLDGAILVRFLAERGNTC